MIAVVDEFLKYKTEGSYITHNKFKNRSDKELLDNTLIYIDLYLFFLGYDDVNVTIFNISEQVKDKSSDIFVKLFPLDEETRCLHITVDRGIHMLVKEWEDLQLIDEIH